MGRQNEEERMIGCLLGTAAGDSLGLPYEAMNRSRARKIFGDGPLRHRLFFGRGMISDDTEHAAMTAQALIESGGEPVEFCRRLACLMKMWMLGIPAGVGFATLRAILRLWAGIKPERSGVFSAGNGPAMRSPIIGAFAHDDKPLMRELVRASTRMTHTDPRAEEGAFLIALASAYGFTHGPVQDVQAFVSLLKSEAEDEGLSAMMDIVEDSLLNGSSPEDFLKAIGCENGVSGFINHTVPASLFCWLKYQSDPSEGIEQIVRMGGDTDTTAAILGGMTGLHARHEGLPNGVDRWDNGLAAFRGMAEGAGMSAVGGQERRREGESRSVPHVWDSCT